MKRSTAFLTVLGISVLLIGVGLVLTLPGQTFFPDNYPAQLPLFGLGGIGYAVGDFFIMYIPPGSEALQYVPYPLTSLNYFGGFLASNSPVDVSVFGHFDLYGTPLIEINNVRLATYFTDLYSNPLAFGGVLLNIVNSGSEPVIVIGQSRQYTISLNSNPMVGFGYALMALGVFIALVGMVGEVVRPEPLKYIPSSAGETVSTGLRIWKRIFASTVIPYGLIFSVYELVYLIGYSYYLTSPISWGSTALTEAYAIQYGLMFIGYFFIVVATGIVIKATSDIIEGKNTSLIQNLKHVLRRSGKMYIAYFVYGLIVGFGFVLLIVPGIYLAIIFSLVLPAILITDNGPMESFSTSKMLTENDKIRTLGVLLASGLLALIASIPLSIIAFYVFSPIPLEFGYQMFSAPITSQLIGFNLPLIFAFTIVVGIIGASTAIISPIIITTWFYALGGTQEKARERYIPTKPGEEVRACPNCKRTISRESKFCPYCGQKQT